MHEVYINDLDHRSQEYHKSAVEGYEHNENIYAREIALALLKRFPNCSQIRELLHDAALTQFKQHKPSLVSRIINRFRASFSVFLCSCVALKPLKSFKYLERAIKLSPNYSAPFKYLTKLSKKLHWPELELVSLEALHRIDPLDEKIAVALCEQLVIHGKTRKAIEIGEQALLQFPSNTPLMHIVQHASVEHSTRVG